MNSFSYFIPFPLNGSGFLNDLIFAATAPNFSLFEPDNFIVFCLLTSTLISLGIS